MSHLREDGKIDLPKEFATIIALMDCGEIGATPQLGFLVKHKDGDALFVDGKLYSFELVLKWDYLNEVLPGYAIGGGK